MSLAKKLIDAKVYRVWPTSFGLMSVYEKDGVIVIRPGARKRKKRRKRKLKKSGSGKL